jgi:hypothetical protein
MKNRSTTSPSLGFDAQFARRRNAISPTVWGCAALMFSAACLLVLYLQIVCSDFAFEHDLVIPDVYNIQVSLGNFARTQTPWSSSGGLLGNRILYGWFGEPSMLGCAVVNALLIAVACCSLISFSGHRKISSKWVALGLFGNLYLVLAFPGPNKEMAVLLATVVCFIAVAQRRSYWLLLALLASVATYVFRDGFGVMLMLLVLLNIVRWGKYWQQLLVILCIALLANVGETIIAPVLPFYDRQTSTSIDAPLPPGIAWFIEAAGAPASEPLMLRPLLLLLRFIYNCTTHALFPQLFTVDGEVSVLGVAYFLNGIALIFTVCVCVSILLNERLVPRYCRLGATWVVGVLIMMSVSPSIQPRYFMPLWPIGFLLAPSVSGLIRFRCLLLAAGVPAAVIAVNAWMGRLPAPSLPFQP